MLSRRGTLDYTLRASASQGSRHPNKCAVFCLRMPCKLIAVGRRAQVTGGSEGLISWQADVVLQAGDPGYSARRRLTGFPLPGTRGYPRSHYKCARVLAMRTRPMYSYSCQSAVEDLWKACLHDSWQPRTQ